MNNKGVLWVGCWLIFLIFSGLISSPAFAMPSESSPVIAQNLKEPPNNPPLVIQGRVLQIASFWSQQGWMYSIATIAVEPKSDGKVTGDQIRLRYNGGTIGETSFHVDTEPWLQEGDRIRVTLVSLDAQTYTVENGINDVEFLDAPQIPQYAFLGGRWADSRLPVPYYINEAGTGDTDGEFDAVQAAYQSWNNVSCNTADFSYQGTTSALPGSNDGLNVIGWLPDAQSPCPGVIACSPLWIVNGEMVEADIVFNENKAFSIGGTFDIQAITTHEGGHTFGLDHSSDSNAVMNAHYPGGTRWRNLTQDDINGICSLYTQTIPAYQNIVMNASFETNNLNNWWAWGDVDWAFYGDQVLHFKRRATINGGAIGQNWEYYVPTNAPFEIRLQLGNASSVTKNPGIFVRSGDHWDIHCRFTIPAGSPLQTYIIRGRNTTAWYGFNLEVWPDPPDGVPDVLMDNISIQYRPDLNPIGTECYYPNQVPALPTLTSPSNGATLQTSNLTLSWTAGIDDGIPNAPTYWLQVDDNEDFSSPLVDTGWSVTGATHNISLAQDGRYYWRVSQGDGEYDSGWTPPAWFDLLATTYSGFCDDFESSSLNPGWQWVDPLSDSGYSLSAQPGQIRFSIPDGEHDLYINQNAPRLLQPVDGNFTINTKLSITPSYSYQGAGLLIWQDQNNYIRLERTYGWGMAVWYRKNGVYDGLELPFSAPVTYIKIQRAGNDFTAWYSADNASWNQAISLNFPSDSRLQVGMVAINQWQDNPVWADFDYFHFAGCEGNSANTLFLPMLMTPDVSIPVSSVLTPFDGNLYDTGGPSSWSGSYGKTPEIIVASNGYELDVLAQDYNPDSAWKAVLLHIEPKSIGSGYKVTQALTNLPMLDRVMGLALDASGNRYYATGVNESSLISPFYPPLNIYRSDIVRVVKLDPAGSVLFNTDLDVARYAYNPNAEMIINPMVAATSRLLVGGNEVALVHGINTGPDWNINGVRHQKALSTRLDASTGLVTRASSVWVSHSFDQRLFYDGSSIIEHHLGDAYPRSIVFAKDHQSYPLFQIKGDIGDNNTYTRLGNIALIENDPDYDYVAIFATESSATTGNRINGSRNLAFVRVKGSDSSIDPNLPDTLIVNIEGTPYTNRLKWMTTYSVESHLHAERPKLVGIGNDRYVVLWEEWRNTDDWNDAFNGVFAMLIDDKGQILQPATLMTADYHLPRGDDAFLLGNRAAWMTGSEAEMKLELHFVDEYLNYERVTLE